MKERAPTELPVNDALLARIELRLKALGKSARKACRDGEIDQGSVNNIRQGKTYWPSGDILGGLAIGLDCTTDYLIFGMTPPPPVNHSLGNLPAESGMGDGDSQKTEGINPMTSERWELRKFVETLKEEEVPTAMEVLRNWTTIVRGEHPANPQVRRKTS